MSAGRDAAPRAAGAVRAVAAGAAAVQEEDIAPSDWAARAHALYRDGWWFEALWAPAPPRREIRALWSRPGQLLMLRLECPEGSFPTLTTLLPASDWFERAARDAAGLASAGHVDPRPFRFHESYPAGHVDGRPLPAWSLGRGEEYPFTRHEGEGIFEIPVGPIHAGIIEPGHFRFTTAGEIVLDLEVRLNYTHKGTMALARGKPVEHALRLMERLSGDNAAAHACAFASACEAAGGVAPPEPVQRLRTAMVEMERAACHFGDLGGLAVDVAFSAAAAHFQVLREEMLRWNQRLFGHRLLMNAVAVGGVHRVPDGGDWAAFQADLARIARRFDQAARLLVNHSGLKERVEGTGQLQRATAELLGCVGPTARASGIPRDARLDHPCLAYAGLRPRLATRTTGTVAGRMLVRADEARESLNLLMGPLADARDGAEAGPREGAGPGEGLALVEAPRGAVLSWVRLGDGMVVDAYQRDPSFLNWRALEEAAHRNIVPDFPLINKSFGLSYSGSDA